jgi:CBS-domain-containing membrane protein
MLKEKKLSGHNVSEVRHLHTHTPVTIQADASIASILEAAVSKKHCNNVYVVDSNNTLMGMVKPKDILKELFPITSLASGIKKLNDIPVFNAAKAKDIMTPALSVKESTSLSQIVSILLKEDILELPVVNDENKVIGQVDASEIIALSMTSENK